MPAGPVVTLITGTVLGCFGVKVNLAPGTNSPERVRTAARKVPSAARVTSFSDAASSGCAPSSTRGSGCCASTGLMQTLLAASPTSDLFTHFMSLLQFLLFRSSGLLWIYGTVTSYSVCDKAKLEEPFPIQRHFRQLTQTTRSIGRSPASVNFNPVKKSL